MKSLTSDMIGLEPRWRSVPPVAKTRLPADEMVRRAAFVAAVGSLFACAFLGILQVGGRAASVREVAPELAQAQSAGSAQPVALFAADGDALLAILPERINGFRTAARHATPGLDDTMAEAIYTPLDEVVRMQMPLNAYVGVRRLANPLHPGELEGLAGDRRADAKVPDAVVSSGDASFAYHDGSKYVVVWAQSGYVITVDTRFTVATPADAPGVLELHGEAVAAAVATQIGAVRR